jgi:sugar (glycoside-pentoside-hexuronide) transporter
MTDKLVSATTKLRTYTPKERNIYLISLAGQNVIYNIIGACLAYYLQFTILIPAMSVSLIMTLARVWDAFNDPIMGTIVDRTRTKIGKCRPYLIAVPIPILIITLLCFTNFGFYGDAANSKALNNWIVAWAAITYILWGMTYTVGDIPLWSVTALMTEDSKDRNKLLSLARIFGGIGGGVTLLAMQPLALGLGKSLTNTALAGGNPAMGEKYGFLIAAAIFAIIGCGLFQMCGFAVRERISASKTKYTLVDNFKIMWRNKPFRQVLLSGVLGSPKMLLALAAMPLVTYYFASKSAILALLYMALLGGGMFVGQFVAMALTPKLLTKFTKKKLYNYGNLVGIVPFLLIYGAYLVAPNNLTHPLALTFCFIVFLFSGGSMGLTTVLQSLMIADAVDYEEYTNGIRPDGVFFSGQTFIAKLTTGIATIISGVAYSVVRFSDSRVAELNAFISAGGIPRLESHFSSFMGVLFFLVSIPPAIGCILSVIPTWKYALDDDEHKRILGILNERRHQKTLDEEVEVPEAAE